MFDFAALGIDVPTGGGGNVMALCPECSHTRKKSREKCLSVNVDDGVYKCHHCGWSGKAKDPNWRPTRAAAPKPKQYRKPALRAFPLSDAAEAWFAKRGIPAEVLERNEIASTMVWMPQVEREVSVIAFPYRRGGELVNVKYRDHQKNFRMEKDAELIAYGLDDAAETTVIVEGEIDKLSVEVAGLKNCVSVPNGAPPPGSKNMAAKLEFLAEPKLEAVRTWIIAVDADEPGQCLQEELIRRFGAEKCLVASFPEGCKDANDVLRAHGAHVLRECLDKATPPPITGVFEEGQFRGAYDALYADGVPNGISTGWSALDAFWRVQPGQLLVVTGIPGHGKSEFVDALCVNLAVREDWFVAMYSPENYPVELHMMKLAEKFVGAPFNAGLRPRMSAEDKNAAADWIGQHFAWVMPSQPSLDEIMDKARALVARRGARILVIDPWNEVEHARPQGTTEAEYVSTSLMKLRLFTRRHKLLTIVVAHPRLIEKSKDGSYPCPSMYDISGGAMWRNKADNGIAVYCPDLAQPRVQIHVQKVKFKLFGHVGMAELDWDRVTGRYTNATSEVQY